jgi:hypothetical protein
LGGKDITTAEFDQIIEDMQAADAEGAAPPPKLLYTSVDDAQMQGFLRLAGKGARS